ncbi:glycosyltransferase [Aureisphaera sp. CAU 1614]|uniref:Glycosyltransferase n=1 Tax=Halomarinibacterium sedimenti TaxID=2857106 RepID=A0A9X1JZV2_9FLAO|nr:glycosyltransferase family 2 protein [Halomarinibacterium sedimenti]MBW2937726.1 glycosyltransferase [Halomarinibacterium sedimenti]
MDTPYPKISVVTPNYNLGDFIESTILSVLNQHYPNLEYIIIDGGSIDNSLQVIKKYESKISYFVTEPDKGMYDAINKGFAIATGDILCWINSDDVLWEGSLHYVAKIFTENKQVQWLQGFPSLINEDGELVFQRKPVVSKFHFYLRKYKSDYSFIQQESTFWTKKLWDVSGGKINTEYTLAGDFDLWMRFFKYEKLYASKIQLGAFREREGQLSKNMSLYLEETEKSIQTHYKTLSFTDRIYLWYLNFFKINYSIKIKYID